MHLDLLSIEISSFSFVLKPIHNKILIFRILHETELKSKSNFKVNINNLELEI